MAIANPAKSRSLWWLIGFLAMWTQSAPGYATDDANQQIHALIQKIGAEQSANARAELAGSIADVVQTTSDRSRIQDQTLDEMAALLRHPDDSVRLWVALAFGQLGSSAKRAVPALEAALIDVEREDRKYMHGPSLSSGDAICPALKAITGIEHPHCPYLGRG